MWVMFVQIGRSTSELKCFYYLISCSKRLWPLSCNVIGPMYLVWSSKGLDTLVLCRTFCGGSHSKCSLMPPWWIQACQQLDALRKNILCLALSIWWIVQGAVVVLLQRQNRLVILLERQEVNPEAVRHRLLLGVVLEMASNVEKNLGQHFTNGWL